MHNFSSVTVITVAGASERYMAGGDAERERSIDLPTTHLQLATVGLAKAYAFVTSILRLLVRALYAFPILVVVKVILHVAHPTSEEDYITVAFVVLVVALFGALALVMLLFAVLGPRSSREKQARLVFRPPRASDAHRFTTQALPKGGAIRVSGQVNAGLEPGATVLEDSWGDDGGTIVRFFEGSSFVVTPDDGTAVVVELMACPVVLASYDSEGAQLVVPGVGAVTPLGRFKLRQGDRVEVMADEGQPGSHPLLHEGGVNPYREAEGGALVVTSRTSSPVVIRALR